MRYGLSFLSLLVFAAGSAMLSSCEKECFSPACLDDAPDVRLDQPQAGQRSYFLRYESTCDKPSGDFEYTGDTLILEVIEAGPTVRFKESFTPGSPLWQPNIGGPPTEDGYVVHPFDDYLLLPERQGSNLFFFYGNDTLWLNRPYDLELEQEGCQLMHQGTPFIGVEQGQLSKFRMGEVKIDDQKAVSCVPGFLVIDAFLLYNPDYLSVSQTMTGPQVNGWVRLER